MANAAGKRIAFGDVPNIAIKDKLRYFDPTGTLADRCAKVLAMLRGHERSIIERYWQSHAQMMPNAPKIDAAAQDKLVTEGVQYIQDMFGHPTQQPWADMACKYAWSALAMGENLSVALATLSIRNARYYEVLMVSGCEDPVELAEMMATVGHMTQFEADIVTSYKQQLDDFRMHSERRELADKFETTVSRDMLSAQAVGAQLGGQTSNVATSARSMLNKASEVAAAAEQSALAMREAARTAAGLIRAIDTTRQEVDNAVTIADRAGEQASEALNISTALSDQAETIESILGLIRDVAGQTNLLALNATIEAARAGDAGRGFAVVAQEVKSLANQTARATDDIASKIAVIQSATRTTVEANGSIRETVEEVKAFAARVREAMEAQARTVTTITAAVDETALAADSMSGTIAAIREDTDRVVSEIVMLESGFGSINDSFAAFAKSANEFSTKVA